MFRILFQGEEIDSKNTLKEAVQEVKKQIESDHIEFGEDTFSLYTIYGKETADNVEIFDADGDLT
jgi:hypothetical protein